MGVWLRLASGETPVDYQILVYEKGAFVLHMLRMLFFDFSAGNDEPFRAMMRDFVEAHRGDEATTEDFRHANSVLAEVIEEDW